MKCLENLIGLKGICEPEIGNCRYIDGLPFFDVKNFSLIAKDQDIRGEAFFKRIRECAAIDVKEHILGCINGFHFNEVIEQEIDGKFDIDCEFVEVTEPVGRVVYRDCEDHYITPYVQWIKVKVREANTITVKITTQHSEKSFDVDVFKGVNEIPIECKEHYQKITIEGENLWIAEAECSSCYCDDNCSCTCHSCDSCYRIENCNIETTGLKGGSSFTPFAICVQCICDEEAIVCKYKNQAKHLMYYMTAAKLYYEMVFNTRKNAFARNVKDEAEALYVDIGFKVI